MRLVTRPRRTFAIAATAALLAVGCGSDADEDADDGDGAAGDVTTTEETTTTEADEDSTTTSTTTTTIAAIAGGSGGADTTSTAAPTTAPPESTTTTTTTALPDCSPVGEWRLREQEYVEELAVLAGAQGDVSFEHRGGAYFVTIDADGTYVGERAGWQIGLTSPEGVIVLTIDSVDEGTWSVDGDRITMSDPGSPANVRIQAEVGGVLQDLPVGNQTVGTSGITGSGTYACPGDGLEITVDELPDLPAGATLTAAFDPA